MTQEVESSPTYQAYCGTCRATQTFLTPQGMNYFRNEHEGHIVEIQEQTAGGEAVPRRPAPAAGRPAQAVQRSSAVTPEREAPAGLDDGLSLQTVDLKRLAVDLANNDGEDAFTIIGFSGSYHTFVRNFGLGEATDAERFIGGGAYIDEYGNDYRWTADIVELTPQARGLLTHLQAPTTVNAVRGREASGLLEEPQSSKAALPPEPLPTQAVSTVPQDHLLLGKDSRLQEGEEYVEVALKISDALREFRWNAEPPYVIGAVFDNIVGIQSQAGALSKEVIEKIEELGYRFVAVDAPKGRVTGWFKKVGDPVVDRSVAYEPDAGDLDLGDFRGAFALGGKQHRVKKSDEARR